MITGDIIRTKDGRRFRMGRVLKAGLIGIVHEGFEEGTEKKVAIKTPAPNLSQDAQSRFRQEYDVLKALADKMADRLYVPWVLQGENETSSGKALVMEYIGEDRLLTDHLPPPETPGLKHEKMALRAAVQYARLLEFLHESDYTCQDRKLADLRWLEDGEDGRLVVLDWNVVGIGEAQRVDDIYLFGMLWYQLLAGRYPSATLNLLDDNLWRDGRITYGTRQILAKILSRDAANQFPTAKGLRQQLQNREQVLAKSGQQLLHEAYPLYEQLGPFLLGQQDPSTPPDFRQEWQALDLFDLAWRLGEQVESERDELLQLVQDQGNRLINQIEQAFLNANYNESIEAVQQAIQIAQKTNDNGLRLRILRWQRLVKAGLHGLDENIFLKKMGLQEPLVGHIQRLETASEATTDVQWVRWINEYEREVLSQLPATGKKATIFLQELKTEMEVRQLWHHTSSLEQREAYQEAEKVVDDLVRKLEAFTSTDSYKETLQNRFPQDLLAWQQALATKARMQETLNYWEEKLSTAAIQKKPYYLAYLMTTNILDELSAYNEMASTTIDEIAPILPLLNELYLSRDYAVIEPARWDAVVVKAKELLSRPSLPEPVRVEAELLLAEAKKTADIYFELSFAATDRVALAIYEAFDQENENP